MAEEKVSPEIQEQFDIFITNGMNIIHDPKVSDGILNRIMQGGDPVKNIAEATVDIVTRLADSASESGMALSDNVLVHGSNFLMGEIISLAEAAGMQKLTEEQRTQSYQLATSLYLDDSVKAGKISPEQLSQLGEQAKQSQPEAGEQMRQPEQQNSGILNQGGM